MKGDNEFKNGMVMFFGVGPGCIAFTYCFMICFYEYFMGDGITSKKHFLSFLLLVYYFLLGFILDYYKPLSILININLIMIWFPITNIYAIGIPVYYIWGICVRNFFKEHEWF